MTYHQRQSKETERKVKTSVIHALHSKFRALLEARDVLYCSSGEEVSTDKACRTRHANQNAAFTTSQHLKWISNISNARHINVYQD